MFLFLINNYYIQLITCMVQFIDKMPELTSEVFDALIKYWPIASTSKEVIYFIFPDFHWYLQVKFLTEIEEILTGIDAEQFKNVIDPLFKQLAKSILSPHFQVRFCIYLI